MAENPSSPAALPDRQRARLIPGWGSAWRLWSVRIATLGAGLMTAWSSLPDGLRAALPYADRIAAGLFVAVTVARLVAQEEPRRKDAGHAESAR